MAGPSIAHFRGTHWRRSTDWWCAGDLWIAEDTTVSNNDKQLVPEDVANVRSRPRSERSFIQSSYVASAIHAHRRCWLELRKREPKIETMANGRTAGLTRATSLLAESCEIVRTRSSHRVPVVSFEDQVSFGVCPRCLDKYLGSWRRPLHDWRFAGSWPLPLWPQARSAGCGRRVLCAWFRRYGVRGCVRLLWEHGRVPVRLDKTMVESGDSLRGYPAGVRSVRMSSSSRRLYSRSRRKRSSGSPQPPLIQSRQQLLSPRHARHPCLPDRPVVANDWIQWQRGQPWLCFDLRRRAGGTCFQADGTNPQTLWNRNGHDDSPEWAREACQGACCFCFKWERIRRRECVFFSGPRVRTAKTWWHPRRSLSSASVAWDSCTTSGGEVHHRIFLVKHLVPWTLNLELWNLYTFTPLHVYTFLTFLTFLTLLNFLTFLTFFPF